MAAESRHPTTSFAIADYSIQAVFGCPQLRELRNCKIFIPHDTRRVTRFLQRASEDLVSVAVEELVTSYVLPLVPSSRRSPSSPERATTLHRFWEPNHPIRDSCICRKPEQRLSSKNCMALSRVPEWSRHPFARGLICVWPKLLADPAKLAR